MNNQFGIQIEDGSDKLSSFAVKNNSKSIELYDWQRRAKNFFLENNKALFEVCTGAGKTFYAIEVLKELWKIEPDMKVLIVVPKNIILEDTWFKELYRNGISLKDIGVYYGAIKEYGKVTITNMQNLENIALEIFDCVILDEIHNYGTERLLPLISHSFKYKIGLSATLERMDDTHLQIMKIFDYNIFKYSAKDALSEGILNPFNFTNIGVELDTQTMDEYNKLTEELNLLMQMGGGYGRLMRTNSGLKYRMLAKMNERKNLVNNYPGKFDVIKEICLKHKDDKVLVFNEYNEQTTKCYWYLLDIGVSACIVHSDISKEKREQYMIDYKKGKYQVMLTTKVLDEGYNLPEIDVGIIMAGNSTARQTIQRMGRILRKKNIESSLYQIYCLGTIEETYGKERAKLFKELCSKYIER